MVRLLSPRLWEAVEVPVALGTGSASEGPGPPSQPDGALQLGASWRVSHTSGSAWLGPCVPWSQHRCLQHPSARCEQDRSPALADATEDLLERRSSLTLPFPSSVLR